MLTVSHDSVVVELNLLAGRVVCPDCGGRLRPWGWARDRVIREGLGTDWVDRRLRPRRSRCTVCLSTHVLLEVRLAMRRADAAEVIAAAVEAKTALGWGHRKIAAGCGRPVSTVRGWLRALAASAGAIGERFTSLLVRDAPDAVVLWPKPAGTAGGEALSVLMAYAEGLGRRFAAAVTVTWIQAGIATTNGRLFCSSWWAAGPNTNRPLRPGVVGGKVGRSACHIPVVGVFTV
ncbi:hypothetical protein [Cryobacterium psychrophilum]|uniref:Uncharacterized protein n=1 Tax=Cryobacterium psychrophilum TaxID=41988 RepID=A0A4Y8KP83_9MICO|nr:hypothetical protein [Cryobacterium psychrophilum]TDW28844.1 hypothetical protein EDD25_0492 [Cryobacterium psychrophilum]TFD76187.1 hypothetical protein E3T53_14205 [Cryobacterium psychrophilum]